MSSNTPLSWLPALVAIAVCAALAVSCTGCSASERSVLRRIDQLVVECYGNGYALLRPEESDQDDDPRYVLTQRGRYDLRCAEAAEHLFGPWPTVAEAYNVSTPASPELG